MKFLLSTIADVKYDWDEENQTDYMHYEHSCGPIAQKYGMGLELAEYCISDNCENDDEVKSFFNEQFSYTDYFTFHAAYNELFPHAIDPAIARIAKMRYEQCYNICKENNIDKMIVHANFIGSLYYPTWFISKQIDFWKEFLDNNPGECLICIENVMEPNPDLIIDIVKGVDNTRFKMTLDIGHANLHTGLSPYEWLEKCAPYISHLHIHNNDGPAMNTGSYGGTGDYHRGLANGIIDYEKILIQANELIKDNLTATIESTEMEESISWLKERGFI